LILELIGRVAAWLLVLCVVGVGGITLAGQLRPADPADQVIFSSDRAGGRHLYALDLHRPMLTGLTRDSDYDGEPARSADGARIAFASRRADNMDIYIMTSDGRGLRRVTTALSRENEPAWSPDGAQLAFASDRSGRWNLYTLDLACLTETQPDACDAATRPLVAQNYDMRSPVWSPDGRWMIYTAYIRNWGVWVLDTTTSEQRVITNNNGNRNVDPQWSPDGNWLVFASDRYNRNFEIYLMSMTCLGDGSPCDNLLIRLTDDPAWDSAPVWSADGQSIIFSSHRDGGSPHLFIMGGDGSGLHQLTDGESRDGEPG
jgi:TolB protein